MNKALDDSRSRMIAILVNTDKNHRHHRIETPMGEIDPYQVVLFVGTRSQRHTFQMKEVPGELATN